MIKRFWFPATLLLLCIFLAVIIFQPFENENTMESFGPAPDFALENTKGQTVTLEDTKDKARLFYFFFSHCPDVCLPTTAMLSNLQRELKDRGIFASQTALLSITFDPNRDTREHLQEFAAVYDADPDGWVFLRGEEESTKELAKKFKINVIKDNDGNFLHTNYFILVDAKGQFRRWYDANDLELSIKQIADDMEFLTNER